MSQNEAMEFQNEAPESEFLRDVLEGFARPQKVVSPKYFYDSEGSALFDQICELDEYYVTRTELSILRQNSQAISSAVGKDCWVVELGSGSCAKTEILIEALDRPKGYVAVEISETYVESSLKRLKKRFPGLAVHAVCADFMTEFRLPEVTSSGRRLLFFPGSTIGNFDPLQAVILLRRMRNVVGPDGGALIGVDLVKSLPTLLNAYNDRNGVTARFNLNLLKRINDELEGDFELSHFEHRAVFNPEMSRIEMHLVSRRDQKVRVSGREFGFREGEYIHTENSYKYSIEAFERMTSQAGFRAERAWTDEGRNFAIFHLSCAAFPVR